MGKRSGKSADRIAYRKEEEWLQLRPWRRGGGEWWRRGGDPEKRRNQFKLQIEGMIKSRRDGESWAYQERGERLPELGMTSELRLHLTASIPIEGKV